jgi:gliding motility-associated-like protein
MRNTLPLLLLFFSTISFSQGIVVDTTSMSIPQLVRNILMQNSCSNETNFLFSSHRGIGQFTNTNTGFPVTDGIIIRNGIAKYTEGPYTGTNESTQITTSGDTDLQTISNNNGQTAPITDVTFLQFDFTPLSSNFSFDFLFASNEYGQYQCGFSDVFAFILTDLTTGTATNLAVIPGTSTPVSVKNIRDAAYNNSCLPANANLFSRYNVANPAISAINMRGETVLLTASSTVIPNRTYRIRLAIGDYLDSQFDSAVFIKGGSFTTTTNLGPDQTICQGESILLDSGLGVGYTFSWTLNGVIIPGQTNATFMATQAGTYEITATLGGCVITDEVILSDLQTGTPDDLIVCNTGQPTYQYDLTQNNLASLGINPADYSIMYFASLASANANGPQIPVAQLSNYTSTGNQTIYIKVMHLTNGNAICTNLLPFRLLISTAFTATIPPTLNVCDNNTGTVDLTTQNTLILNGQIAANFNISYFTSQSNAQNNVNAIVSASAFPMTIAQSPQVIWTRMEDATNPNCFKIVSFSVVINPKPLVSTIPDPLECSNFTLPVIANGTYFTGPNGTGTQLNPGDIINASGTYYIFTAADANGCINQSSFNAFFIDEYSIPLGYCGTFTVPLSPYSIGAFYTAAGGPSGTGTLIPSGTNFTNGTQATQLQTVYYYAEVKGVLCRDQQFDISIYAIPLVDSPAPVTTCNNYSLPALTNGSYFTGAGGTGTPLNAGNPIISSQTIYVFNSNPNCTNENPFTINIVDTSLFQPVTSCGSYMLPTITFGGYYTAPMGGGTPLDPNIPITTSQIVYYYANTTTMPNCTDNLNYNITINPRPLVDTISSGTFCGEFSLPLLTNGTYYTLPGGSTVVGQVQLNPGDIIDLTGLNLNPDTYYVYVEPDALGCDNESSFTINLNPYPITDNNFDTNRVECSPYSIPQPVNGTVYTAPGGSAGTGVVVLPTDVFNTTQTFYLFNIDNITGCTVDKPIIVTFSGLNLPDYQDVKVCELENYTLPALTYTPTTPFNYTIGYFYNQGGVNPVPNNTVFSTPNTQTTIWIYATNGDRITCMQEESFNIIVSETPVLPAYATGNEYCESYTLPAFPLTNYTVNYYSQTGGVGLIAPANYTYTAPTTSGTYTVFVYATATNNTNCYDETQFTFTVHPLLDIHLTDGTICVDSETGEVLRSYTINTGLNPVSYTVNWYLNGVLMGTGPSYTATQEGTYNVEFIKLIPNVGADCNYNNTTVTVTKSGPAVAVYIVSSAFENNSSITVTITSGYGDYLFQLEYPDGTLGLPQTGNVFENLNSGVYYVNIDDQKGGCSPTRIGPIHIINYPHFFTPNGDAYNNSWNIWDLAYQPDARIYIFDRFGKFIKQLSPTGQGWDGTYNGEQLPSTDYWFQVFYKNNDVAQEFKAHFSMKR